MTALLLCSHYLNQPENFCSKTCLGIKWFREVSEHETHSSQSAASSAVKSALVLSTWGSHLCSVKYLVAPRLVAAVAMLPLLVLVADTVGVMGGYLVGVGKLGFDGAAWIDATWRNFEVLDVVSGLVKAAVFGLIVSLMGCYHGYRSRRGAQGVGAATTNAVVSASVLILMTNYFVTELFFSA